MLSIDRFYRGGCLRFFFRTPFPLSDELFIQENHLDTFGHVNNAVYLQIFEQARWDLITRRGYGIEKIKESGLGPVILEANVKFRREVKNRTHIVVRTTPLEYRGFMGQLRQRVYKKATGDQKEEMACEAIFTVALWDTDKRKLVKPTPEWAHALMLDPDSFVP